MTRPVMPQPARHTTRRKLASASKAVESLHTLRDMLRWGVSRLAQCGVQTGHGTLSLRDEAALLILWSLHLPPDELDMWLDARLVLTERKAIVELIETRCSTRQPAAYLTGEAWLRGVCFRSDARALVPRSLIAEALDTSLAGYLTHFPRPDGWPASILDLCTGGGSLAVLAALRYPLARIVGSDLSGQALSLARENLALHAVGDQVTLVEGDLFDPLKGRCFDLILCNPPYVNERSMKALPQEFRAEPRAALAGGADGMDIVRRVIANSAAHLSPGGLLILEIGHEADHFEQAFATLEFSYLPIEAGERMLVLVEAAVLHKFRAPSRSRRR